MGDKPTTLLKRFSMFAVPAVTAALISISAIFPISSSAQEAEEYKVKAAFLYNFLKFVQWPEEKEKYTICILGQNPFGKSLEPLLQRDVNGSTIKIIPVNSDSMLSSQCVMLFVSASEETALPNIIAAVANKPILTVSDIDHFIDNHGMIAFTKENGKIRFAVNTAAAKAAQLKFSSKLLELAVKVE